MHCISRLALGLSTTLLALSAAASPLPDAATVQAAIQQALAATLLSKDRESPDAFAEAFAMGRLHSSEVIDVPGCLTLPTGALNCIVVIDYGLGKVANVALVLERRGKRWKIQMPPEGSRQQPEVPAPTLLQVQAIMREEAGRLLAHAHADDIDMLRRAATGYEPHSVNDCELDERNDPIVYCDVAASLPATPDAPAFPFTKRMRFRLQGTDWRHE
jgi:hypothetical protein